MEATRLELVRRGEGVTAVASELDVCHQSPVRGVVFRRPAEPVEIEYGLAWFAVNASPAVPMLVDLASELAGAPAQRHARHLVG